LEKDFGTTLTFNQIIKETGIGAIAHAMQVKLVGATTYTDIDGTSSTFDPDSVSNVTAIGLKLTTLVTGANAGLRSLGILLDGKVKTETLSDLNTQNIASNYIIGVGHIKIPLQTDFTQVNSIQVAFNGGGASQSFEIVDKTSTEGNLVAPTIKTYNSSGNLAHAIIDITVTGY